MQNEQVLIALGFSRHPEWDFKSTGWKNYRIEIEGKVFRAYEITCNGPVYVSLGEVVNKDGIVKRWIDCCSFASVARHIGLVGTIKKVF